MVGLKPMVACSECLNESGIMYLCDGCGDEFCKEHIIKTSNGELLCKECFKGHPDDVDSERILGEDR
jgi:predicted nucleic acid binding AN1-type Zn finger protein